LVNFEKQRMTNPKEKKENMKKRTAFLVVGVDCLKSREINFFLSTLNADIYYRT